MPTKKKAEQQVKELEVKAQDTLSLIRMIAQSSSFRAIAVALAAQLATFLPFAEDSIVKTLEVLITLAVLGYLAYRHFLRKTGKSKT